MEPPQLAASALVAAGGGSDVEECAQASALGLAAQDSSAALLPCAGPRGLGRTGTAELRCSFPRLAASLALCLAVWGAVVLRGYRQLSDTRPPHEGLRAALSASPYSFAELSCERCPIGECIRGEGACRFFPLQPSQREGYHCKVHSCKEVPVSAANVSYHISECWEEEGEHFYAVTDQHFPCREVDPKEAEPKESSEEVTSTKEATTTKKAYASYSNIFDLQASKISDEATVHNAHLASYWDLADCGPAGDDKNVQWCGGHHDQPVCKAEVEVNASLCISGLAKLKHVRHKKGEDVWIGGCAFIFYAQYECVPTTTTTTSSSSTSTSSTTSTSSSTVTTSSSTTSTSTATKTTTTTSTATTLTSTTITSTTKTTTTLVYEKDMLADFEKFEDDLLGPDGSWTSKAGFGPECHSAFKLPPAPRLATDLNGLRLPQVCFRAGGPHYVQIIADWGGMLGPHGPVPACQRPKATFVKGIDDNAQMRVAMQMAIRAAERSPDYILNGGDNFYWGGIDTDCGQPSVIVPTGQMKWNYEEIYRGPGLDGKPWLGVLGNHDYGGFRFDRGWDQLISYSWSHSGRWVMPAQYWMVPVQYPGFSVEYFFLDTNVFNAKHPTADPEHNICSEQHTPEKASCGEEGPRNVSECTTWFADLWAKQEKWLDEGLGKSKSEWQIVVTHFPPYYGRNFWTHQARKHGIDMIITGHVHVQELHLDDASNFLRPTTWIVSGGGGGITSEDVPDKRGHDDQYGFFELTLTQDIIEIQGISHGGAIRKVAFIRPRHPDRSDSHEH